MILTWHVVIGEAPYRMTDLSTPVAIDVQDDRSYPGGNRGGAQRPAKNRKGGSG